MLIGIIGESCSGKTTLAKEIQRAIAAEIVSGKDYLRMARSESDAVMCFREHLARAVNGDSLIYVITEPDQCQLLPEGAMRILVRADLDTIKARFRARMRGTLPPTVEQMLERKHGMFNDGSYDYVFRSETDDAAALCEILTARQENAGEREAL